jgi:hypothetical protein
MNYVSTLGGHRYKIAMDFTLNEYLAPRIIEKKKIFEPFWSYHLNSNANLAHLPRNRAKWVELAVLFSSKTAPWILFFSTAMGAKPSFCMKFIAI